MSDKSQTAWHRWQLEDFNRGSQWGSLPILDLNEEASSEQKVKEEKINTEFLLNKLKEAARLEGKQAGLAEGKEEGYQIGYQQGFDMGYQQGSEDGKQAQDEIAEQWKGCFDAFRASLNDLDNRIPEELSYTVLATVKQLIGTVSAHQSENLIAHLTELLNKQKRRLEHAKLLINPEMLIPIETQLGSQLEALGWTLEPTPSLHPLGFQIITSEGDIDGSLETRWQHLCQLTFPEEQR